MKQDAGMIVPRHWAEARIQHREGKRSITVRRFGWSDESYAAAELHARGRAGEALDEILSGTPLPRRERLAAYGEGLPIREEIVAQEGSLILTRNSYGALCLNTPNVLFADVDFAHLPRRGLGPGWGLLLLVSVMLLGTFQFHLFGGVILATAVTWLSNRLARSWRRHRFCRAGTPEQQARRRIDEFAAAHPRWHLRLYRTPAGFRLLALHRCFEPDEAEVAACFSQLGVDAVYARMCRMQQCFRARVSPKPWRVGIHRRIRPPYAAWRAEHATLPQRLRWIADYEGASTAFAACRYIASFGDERNVTEAARQVQERHDAWCRADQPHLQLA
ncbi:hypothetical protein VDQ94_18610 [Xanthomonas campestris pv. campestris]|nr:hypothetical protein [Xanthomonas campestris pv. campestris]